MANGDRRLARRLARGDPGAFASLYDRLGASIYRFLLGRTESVENAEDLLQAVWLRLHRYRAGLARVVNLRAHVLAAARNELLRRGRTLLPETVEVDLALVPADDPERKELESLREALRRLSPERREVVDLKVHGGMTFAEIGEALDISPNTASSRYRYALEDLRRILEASHERR